ncbi:(2Fe-2S)-binding protein [Streptomyces sp. NPDC046976]|uniref:(2Fe-2S)-binding protein n=1 Tax=Streptomyces sp. NPDC046976 TaxID=3155258 RepID=UPI0033F0CB0D
MDLDPELAALRPPGPFFALRTDPYGDPAGLPTLAAAYAPDGPDDPLTARVRLVAHRLRTPEPRVAASLAQQGLAARLWSVALGCAVLYGRLPELRPSLLRWDIAATAPDDLWLTEVSPAPGDFAATALADAVLHGHLEPLGETLRAHYGIASGLLWGNAGSALAGAARELERWARAEGRTDTAARTRALAGELFAHPLLRTTGTRTGTRTGTSFRRRSCCLYYRVPGGGVCGDCCFSRPPAAPGTRTSTAVPDKGDRPTG